MSNAQDEFNEASNRRLIITAKAKVAWIRNPNAPMGQPAIGRLNCPCGNAPESRLDPSAGDVTCGCGVVYSYNGWVR